MREYLVGWWWRGRNGRKGGGRVKYELDREQRTLRPCTWYNVSLSDDANE